MAALYQNSELTLVQCECHIGKQTVIYKEFTQLIGNADFTFSRKFYFLVPIFRGANARFSPLRTPMPTITIAHGRREHDYEPRISSGFGKCASRLCRL